MADYHLALPRINWGDTLQCWLNVAHPLEAPTSGSEPRDGFETIRLPSGTEDVWNMPDDYFLRGRVRSIPITDDAYLAATGWDGATGWRAFLEWARRKKSCQFYPDVRNLLVSGALATDSNADGIANDFTIANSAGVTATFGVDSVTELAQHVTLTGGAPAAGYVAGVSQTINGVIPGETVTASVECKPGTFINASPRLYIYAQSGVNGGGSTITANSGIMNTTPGQYARGSVSLTLPAGCQSIFVRCFVYTTAAGGTGDAWFRNVMLERSARMSGLYLDQPAPIECMLVDPMKGQGDVDPDNPYFRSVDLVLRTTGAAFSGY